MAYRFKIPTRVSPSGLSPDLRKAVNELIEQAISNTLRSTPSIRIERTSGGTFLHVERGGKTTTVTDDTWY